VQGKSGGRTGLLLALAALLLTAACGAKRVAPAPPAPPAPPNPTLVVLLPDPGTRVTGRAVVSNEFGSTDLAAPRASLLATATAAPGSVTTMSEEEVSRVFGAALAALPPAPRHFTLQFKFESDALTDASVAQIPAILAAVRAIPVPEVAVVGHTDTMGEPKTNVALGLKRAMTVRNILVQAGLAPSTVDVSSHGEADLAVKTRDKTAEPRNRRVEITVR
jgi:outer membrane protein OmpA-like peptidoglycan-associated protein